MITLDLWGLIDLRNDRQHYQEGLFVWDIPTFNEGVCREAILNAVSHRDYRSGANVFVRQFPRRVEIESPGGLPPGITVENLLFRQHPRNRLLADNLARCGLVERAGQGADMMFRLSIQEGKPRPDFAHTDTHWVFLTLHGTVQDPQFVRFVEKMSKERGGSFGLRDLLVLSLVQEDRRIGEDLADTVSHLLSSGIIERSGRRRLILSRRFYHFLGKPGEYTRRRGLDHDSNKLLLLSHIRSSGREGAAMEELMQVLPAKSRYQVRRMVDELRREGVVRKAGERRWSRWIPVAFLPEDMGGAASGDDQ